MDYSILREQNRSVLGVGVGVGIGIEANGSQGALNSTRRFDPDSNSDADPDG